MNMLSNPEDAGFYPIAQIGPGGKVEEIDRPACELFGMPESVCSVRRCDDLPVSGGLTIDDIVNAMRINGIRTIDIDPTSDRNVDSPYNATLTEWYGSKTTINLTCRCGACEGKNGEHSCGDFIGAP